MKISPFLLVPTVSALGTSSSAENLLAAVGNRNVTQMEALVQGLAEDSVKEPHLKMDKDIQEALKAIRTMFVVSIQKSLIEQHTADQVAHNCGVKNCFEKCDGTYTTDHAACTASIETCHVIRDSHEKCRFNVYGLYKDMAQKCGKLHCFDVPDVKCKYEECICPDLLHCARGHKKDCQDTDSPLICEAVEGNCKSDPKDGYGAWLKETIVKYQSAWDQWSILWGDCTAAYKEFLYADLECDGVQKKFETCMCERSLWEDTICSVDYSSCNTACWNWYEDSVPPLQCQEKDRKIDWASTKKIECYVDVLLHEYTKKELLEKCGSETCINVAREKDYEHCTKVCPEVDHCDVWPKCQEIERSDGYVAVEVQTHEFRKFHDEFFLGDTTYDCDMNGPGVFTEHRDHAHRQAEMRCTEHLDIDFQIPPAPQPCVPLPRVCGPEFHCEYYAKFDDTNKIGCISDCCPEGGQGGCFQDVKLTSCNGDGGAYAADWRASLTFISFGEHTHAWAYNRCECQECSASTPSYPVPPTTRGRCKGIHTWGGQCGAHGAYGQ